MEVITCRKRYTVIFIFVILTGLTVMSQDSDDCACGAGEKYNPDGDPLCLPCGEGTYNDEDCHQHVECKRCSIAYSFNHEWLYRYCTRVSNSVIKCHNNYYCYFHHPGIPGDCTRCMNCSSVGRYEAKRCDEYSDTVCCPRPDMDAVEDEYGRYNCQLLTCNAGQYLDNSLGMCRKCPDRSFRPESKHRWTWCVQCFNLEDNPDHNMNVTHDCNSTHNTQVTCMTGFYQRQPGNSLYFLPECTMCRICARQVHDRFEARPCDKFTDTVCCPEEMMIAVRTDIGFSCKRPNVETDQSTYGPSTISESQSKSINTENSHVDLDIETGNGCTVCVFTLWISLFAIVVVVLVTKLKFTRLL